MTYSCTLFAHTIDEAMSSMGISFPFMYISNEKSEGLPEGGV